MGGRVTVRTHFKDELEAAEENLRDAIQNVRSARNGIPRGDVAILLTSARGHLVAAGDAVERAETWVNDPRWMHPVIPHPSEASKAAMSLQQR